MFLPVAPGSAEYESSPFQAQKMQKMGTCSVVKVDGGC